MHVIMALPVKGGPEGSRGGAPALGPAPLSTAFAWWALCLLCRVLAQICQVGLLSYFLCADQLYALSVGAFCLVLRVYLNMCPANNSTHQNMWKMVSSKSYV